MLYPWLFFLSLLFKLIEAVLYRIWLILSLVHKILCALVHAFFFFFFCLPALWHMEFPGQGSALSPSFHWSHSCGNAGSLTHCAGRGLNLCPGAPQTWLITLCHSGKDSFYLCMFWCLFLPVSLPSPLLPSFLPSFLPYYLFHLYILIKVISACELITS